jgi:1,4-alpha-glucan branching enzyme
MKDDVSSTTTASGAPGSAIDLGDEDVALIVEGRHGDPHRVLGRHDGRVRAYRPGADALWLLAGGKRRPMALVHPSGLYEGAIDDTVPTYRFEATYGADTYVFDDPYHSWPTLGEVDLHLFGEGRHERLWEVLGAHVRVHDGMAGVSFAVWAPNAQAVRVVGDWNFWDGRVHPMRSLGASGVWELFMPGVTAGSRYKYELVTAAGDLILKSDPFAFATEVPPDTASVVAAAPEHQWSDAEWLERRAAADDLTLPMSVYEVHLGSWRHGAAEPSLGPGSADGGDGHGEGRSLTYRELAETLPAYVEEMGFTHVELMPVAEHPFAGSWGYQVTGYYAPTSRFGSPDDFRHLVDAFHARGIGVMVDWVPAHFPRDAWALARFDGTALYEHEDPRKGSHPDWGTLVFNFGRNEVRNFLVANALYWIQEFHIDALRVDAVASMLYLDYSRKEGEWVPNQFGGRENLEAVAFLKEVNETVFGNCPGATVIAEESTSWPAVSRPTYLGGLGFGFKWNMGWMHDTLAYFAQDPLYRRYHKGELTFGLLYAWTENFVLPLSHDEVVHGKKSMLNKMPGDRWQQLANLRALYGWMWAHPGKQLLFMGGEFAQEREWDHDHELDWWTLRWDDHRHMQDMVRSLNGLYRAQPALWERDFTSDGFEWLDAGDADRSVLSFVRHRGSPGSGKDGTVGHGPGADVLVCVANLTPVPQVGYRIGLPRAGRWREVLNTDARDWGGSGMGNAGQVWAEDQPWHGRDWSAPMVLPPLAVLWFVPD